MATAQKASSPGSLAAMLWHPHEGLWNWSLLARIKGVIRLRPLYRAAAALVVLADTGLLFARAAIRRVRAVGVGGLFRAARVPEGMSVVYLDLGTHREAAELLHMTDRFLPRVSPTFQAHGFEASRETFEAARLRLGDRPIGFRNVAVCREIPEGGCVRIYKDGADGLGNSLYRTEGAEYDDVEAIRLSDWIRERGFDPRSDIVLLRMNVEGAEDDVLRDLVDAGLARSVDGWFGMWDDVSKIDAVRDEAFRAVMAKEGIAPFTFNGRDFLFAPRLWCIEYDIETAILSAVKRRTAARA